MKMAMQKLHIKKGDTVLIISGESKGLEGRVLSVDQKSRRAFVEGQNMVSKHAKPSTANPQGGIEKKEASIDISNLMLANKAEGVKVGRKRNEDGKLVRVNRKTREEIK